MEVVKGIRSCVRTLEELTSNLLTRKDWLSCIEDLLYNMLFLNSITRFQITCPLRILTALKHTIDYSKVPKINECDLTEHFVRGSGPGGSAVNKNANCVVLTHKPTGIVIKCHTSRCQEDNRKVARELLVAKLDETLNGPDSVAAQKKRLEEQKYKKIEYKKRKKASLKIEWKKREGLE
ncbi:hypothetical protein K1T71_004113 [Dendrolimus kikuchii]|uniref:Uncharacterized protein n=1 Tax=Dendrolimus kikuchii TaxID=765133 RepID=A0ACC1D9R4_9NEOP|nr:hypothetical protein K1T71_004113 [Dendrolimus kikuchii]